jgi:hypothetical protein
MSDGKEAMRVEPIYPLTEENLDQFRGQLVCVVMKDGTRHVGVLSRCRGGRLVLNDFDDGNYGEIAGRQADAEAKRRSRRRSGSRKRDKPAEETARASGFVGEWGAPYGPYGPYGFFGSRLLLDLALIALVLLIL